MTNIQATSTAMNHTSVQDKEKQIDFIQRIRARRQLMKQTAKNVIEELGLSPESKYDVLSIIYTSSPSAVEQATEKEAPNAIGPLKASESKPALPSWHPHPPSPYDDDNDIDIVLTRSDRFITMVACKSLQSAAPSEFLDLEIDELIQTVRIKLWLTLQKRQIMSLKAYIRAIVYGEVMDLIRAAKRRAIPSLPLDQEGELYQGRLLTTPSEGMQDPAYEVEQKEIEADIIVHAVNAIVNLPPRQQHAIICAIKDQIEDMPPLVEAFWLHQIDIEGIHWPENQPEMHILKASLSIARKKLSSLRRCVY